MENELKNNLNDQEKDLLLKDLCGRIMYGVKCTVYEDTSIHTLSGVLPNRVYEELYFEELDWKECNGFEDIQYCKPYLFPLSGMTEEQSKELEKIDPEFYSLICGNGDIYVSMDIRGYDWLNKNHFDYRGLIPMGLANDATGLNIY